MDTEIYRANFSFTLTIPSFKNIYFKGRRIQYGRLTQEAQYDFLEDHLQNINTFSNIKWVYEEHNDDPKHRLHIHGYIENEYHESVKDFVDRFYSHHKVSMSVKSYLKMSNIQQTLVNIDYFKEYMKKHQDEIRFYMRVIEDDKRCDVLDEKFKVKIECGLNLNSVLKSLDEDNLADEYRFGKQKKFILEI